MKLTSLGAFWNDAVNFVGVRDVQLTALHDLLEVITFVEGAAKARFPRRRIRFVDAFPKLALK